MPAQPLLCHHELDLKTFVACVCWFADTQPVSILILGLLISGCALLCIGTCCCFCCNSRRVEDQDADSEALSEKDEVLSELDFTSMLIPQMIVPTGAFQDKFFQKYDMVQNPLAFDSLINYAPAQLMDDDLFAIPASVSVHDTGNLGARSGDSSPGCPHVVEGFHHPAKQMEMRGNKRYCIDHLTHEPQVEGHTSSTYWDLSHPTSATSTVQKSSYNLCAVDMSNAHPSESPSLHNSSNHAVDIPSLGITLGSSMHRDTCKLDGDLYESQSCSGAPRDVSEGISSLFSHRQNAFVPGETRNMGSMFPTFQAQKEVFNAAGVWNVCPGTIEHQQNQPQFADTTVVVPPMLFDDNHFPDIQQSSDFLNRTSYSEVVSKKEVHAQAVNPFSEDDPIFLEGLSRLLDRHTNQNSATNNRVGVSSIMEEVQEEVGSGVHRRKVSFQSISFHGVESVMIRTRDTHLSQQSPRMLLEAPQLEDPEEQEIESTRSLSQSNFSKVVSLISHADAIDEVMSQVSISTTSTEPGTSTSPRNELHMSVLEAAGKQPEEASDPYTYMMSRGVYYFNYMFGRSTEHSEMVQEPSCVLQHSAEYTGIVDRSTRLGHNGVP